VRVQAIKPDWWPAEWTQVLQQQSAAAWQQNVYTGPKTLPVS
jgi:hypothetical protein